jgi:hypothetical protein
LDQYIAVTSAMELIFKQEVVVYEEMGFNTELKELFHFIYKAPFDNGLTEHELDHVMIGV